MSQSRNVHSLVRTVGSLVDSGARMIIPSYQRPYVWPETAVKKFYEDIKAAWEDSKKTGEHYYIGTVLTAVRENNTLELIDGQQRMTTLTLLAMAFKSLGMNSPLTDYLSVIKEPVAQSNIQEKEVRLTFSIRPRVKALLESQILNENEHPPLSDDEIQSNPYLKQVFKTWKHFENIVKSEFKDGAEEEAHSLGNYIYGSVQWVENQIPLSTDLNKLFATMNTSGIQLAQSDILKSYLFKHIKTDKAKYDRMWQVCENMNNYFESNVAEVFPKVKEEKLSYKKLADIYHDLSGSDTSSLDSEGLTIREIEQLDLEHVNPSDKDKAIDESFINCESIIDFPLFLIHAYRVFLANKGMPDITERVHSDNLIKIFEPFVNSHSESQEVEVKEFVELLWKLRYIFDLWVVKWVEREGEKEKTLALSAVSVTKQYNKRLREANGRFYYSRTIEASASESSMLQSVRYFTGEYSAQYWLTPFLAHLQRYSKVSASKSIKCLENIDNFLSVSNETQKESSFRLAGDEYELSTFKNTQDLVSELGASHYPHISHYWFQKIEYLLWKDAKQAKSQQKFLFSLDDNKLRKYRITSKNSVEHIFPQNEEYGGKLEDSYLHGLGNLVLLNVEQNSSYSNQPPEKKRIDFDRKNHYDSLKLAHAFQIMGNGTWDKQAIEQHGADIIDLVNAHYRKSL